MTYKEIRNKAKKDLGISIREFWIADVKRELGPTTRLTYKRKSKSKVVYNCPDGSVKEWLTNILKV